MTERKSSTASRAKVKASPRERMRSEALDAINARLRKAGVDFTWRRDTSPTFDDEPEIANARRVYTRLVDALREANALDASPGDDEWRGLVRAFLGSLSPMAREWVRREALAGHPRARRPEDWTPLERLVEHWMACGVPWRSHKDRADGGARGGTPTQDDLALIAIVALSPGALALDPSESFADLRDRTVDRVKKEQKRH